MPTARQALRTAALGRKNYLFAASDTGGERPAAIYRLIGDREAERYRSRSLFTRCAHEHRRLSHHGLDDLLPWNALQRPARLA